MAAVTQPSPKAPSDRFSISSLISRFRSRRKHTSSLSSRQDLRAPLNASSLPLVLPEHQNTISQLGWTIVTFPQPPSSNSTPGHEHSPGVHPLQNAYEDLFTASAKFFDLPDEEKARWKTKLGSEEGWSKIPGEKEFITLRTLAYTPDILKEPAKRYWDAAGAYLSSCLGRISSSLGLPDEEEQGLKQFVGPCSRLGEQEEGKTATMLRLFRYEGWEEKVVAEPHADLGLLSMVVGQVPGLEVWNGQQWFPIEQTYTSPCATLLGGRQLQRLSNFRYQAGGHRVVSYGKLSTTGTEAELRYRFSIVFVLRAHEPVIIDSDALETEITGKWESPLKDVSCGTMYAEIRNAHYNINTGIAEREGQRRKLADSKKRMSKETG